MGDDKLSEYISNEINYDNIEDLGISPDDF